MTRRRLYIFAAVALGLLLFWDFADYRKSTDGIGHGSPTAIDAIVVLTGGPKRVRAGLELLVAGVSDRLIISGAGENVTAEAILNANPDVALPTSARIEIDHARDTAGNAAETAAWAAANDVSAILLVTASYHMPRSLLLFERAAPDLAVRPHPVDANAGLATYIAEWLKLRATTLGLAG